MAHLAYLGQAKSYHVEKWLSALAAEGLKITLLSFVTPERDIAGVDVRVLDPPFRWTGERHLRIWHFWGSAKPLKRVLDQIGADVLMASYATNYGFLGARSGFRPMILQTWTADLTVYPWSGWKRWILRPMVRRSMAQADVITTDGPALAERARELYPDHADRIVPVLWGIRLEDYGFSPSERARKRSEMGIPDDAPVFTSARGVLYYYRPETVLRAFLRLLESRKSAHAVFLTLARERTPEVQRLLETLDAHPRGHVFDRFLPVSEMRSIWSITDVLVSVPMFDGISEGILEGMYCGCIPIVSDIPSNRSILEDGESGVFVRGDPGSDQDLGKTLEEVAGRLPGLKSTMVERNRRWVEDEASVESTAAKVAEMVRSLGR